MQKQVLTIEVEFDPTESNAPADWDWTDLAGDQVTVLSAGEVKTADES